MNAYLQFNLVYESLTRSLKSWNPTKLPHVDRPSTLAGRRGESPARRVGVAVQREGRRGLQLLAAAATSPCASVGGRGGLGRYAVGLGCLVRRRPICGRGLKAVGCWAARAGGRVNFVIKSFFLVHFVGRDWSLIWPATVPVFQIINPFLYLNNLNKKLHDSKYKIEVLVHSIYITIWTRHRSIVHPFIQ